MTLDQLLQIVGIIVASILSISIYLLQSRLSDKQKIDNRLRVEREIGKILQEIRSKNLNYKIQLYNSKLIGKKYFSKNKRNLLWGYPYHAAELFALNFDGVEVVCGLEKWQGKKIYKIGLIPYGRVLHVLPDGDGSFNGTILFVKPRILQLDRYSIAYKLFRYYPIGNETVNEYMSKPVTIRLYDYANKLYLRIRYLFFLKWIMLLRESRTRMGKTK